MSRDASAPRKTEQESAFRRFLRRAPRQSRSRAVVGALLQALDEALLRGKVLGDLKVDSLADRAGVGVGSFYEYFSSKESLLGALIGRVTRENFELLLPESSVVERSTLPEIADMICGGAVDAYMTHPGRTRVVIAGIVRLGLVETVIAERDRFARQLAALCHSKFPDLSSRELEERMKDVCDVCMGVISPELYRSPLRSRDEIMRVVVPLTLFVLRGSKPGS